MKKEENYQTQLIPGGGVKKLSAFAFIFLVFQSLAFAKRLEPGVTMWAGQSVCSDNNQYCLTLQKSDGNLVLYASNGQAVWQAKTNGKGVTRAVMQPDGNFVLYTDDNRPIWVVKTERSNSFLNVQDDGNIVFYWMRPIWDSKTSDVSSMQSNEARVLYPNTKLTAGVSYTIGQYFFILQADGNLVLYKNGAAIWNTGTAGKGVTSAWMQNDGNFVLYNDAGTPIWKTNTGGNGNALFAFQPDGNLVIYVQTPSWDRLAGYNHPDYKDHRGPGQGWCIGACGGSIISIPF
ncbi:curculin (mannose-binding) lectin [Burkholderia cepacia]|uniref:curculin (mannose-binding) lectin n=1 Tax=Burkholderia cepacia TaxID=292 RepID=UPI001E63C144|nr:curculin (mannose-binding) lectin [Burkholderia cepacia]